MSAGGIFFKYPSVCIPKYYPNDEFLYQFKRCVIEDVIPNYTPGSVPAFYRGSKAPAEIELRIRMLEIELHLREDYDGGLYSNGKGEPIDINQVLNSATSYVTNAFGSEKK